MFSMFRSDKKEVLIEKQLYFTKTTFYVLFWTKSVKNQFMMSERKIHTFLTFLPFLTKKHTKIDLIYLKNTKFTIFFIPSEMSISNVTQRKMYFFSKNCVIFGSILFTIFLESFIDENVVF